MGKSMRFAEILIELTGGNDPLCTIREISDVMGRDPQTVYGYRNEKSQPAFDDTVRLSRYLIKEYGYYRLAYQMLLICRGNKADGRTEDQFIAIVEHITDCHRACQKSDKTSAINGLSLLKEQINILEQEIEQI